MAQDSLFETGDTDGTAAAFLPDRLTLPALRDAIAGCRACDLYRNATQTVFGEGPGYARVDARRRAARRPGGSPGQPFVGPAGKLFDRAERGGHRPRAAYVTNVVKHFKWQPRGKRRIHAKPSWAEIDRLQAVAGGGDRGREPRVLVCLGATAARRCSAVSSGSRRSAASPSTHRSRPSCSRPSIPRRSCARRSATPSSPRSSPTSASSPG